MNNFFDPSIPKIIQKSAFGRARKLPKNRFSNHLRYIWKRAFLAAILFISSGFSEDSSTIGLIGGPSPGPSLPPFAAVVSSNGQITPLSIPFASGRIAAASINVSGLGLIGGGGENAPFAALVTPNGNTVPLILPFSSGIINDVSINSSGMGLIGGDNSLGSAFGAFVSPQGLVSNLFSLPSSGGINAVSINSSGVGLIGGSSVAPPYAALIAPNGSVTPLTLPSTSGVIQTVSINIQGVGLIGGSLSDVPYAALVKPNGDVIPLDIPFSSGFIESVAINSSSTGLVGGSNFSGSAGFAAFVSSNGTLSPLNLPFTSGNITAVSINSSRQGLVGGNIDFNGPPFAAFVFPDGTLLPLILPFTAGAVKSVAINSAGIGLIGGELIGGENPPFAALVAPNGSLTLLGPLFMSGGVDTTALLDVLVPKSVGPYGSSLNSQFALSTVFEQHYVNQKYLRNACEADLFQIGECCCRNNDNLTLWSSVLGDYVRQNSIEKIPTFTNRIAGAIAALDYRGTQNVMVGGGLAYTFNYVLYQKGLGHASINQESAFFYASLNYPHFFFNIALWGGLYQTQNIRHSISLITSKSKPKGWTLCPHIELSTPFYANNSEWLVIDPFILFDFANGWQNHFHEHGKSGFNIVLNSQHTSLLRSETGLRFYEILQYCWGNVILEEKGSYVNRAPIHMGTGRAYFIGSISSFQVETFEQSVQNLGCIEIHAKMTPHNSRYPYCSFGYQGEFGQSFQSHLIDLEVGMKF